MSQLRFVQLSDTHIRKDYQTGLLHEMLTSVGKPDEKLKAIFSEIRNEKIDFIILTGDLIHEGNEVDYLFLKELLDSEDFQVPVLLALGNHDEKGAFCKVFSKQMTNDRFYYSQNFQDWTVAVLDSTNKENGLGSIDDRQMEWLEELVKEKKYVVVFMHHPLLWNDELLRIGYNSKRLKNVIAKENVKAVFCGHVHRSSSIETNAIKQYTAESTACGFDYVEEGILEFDRSGYLQCSIDLNQIQVENCFLRTNPVYKIHRNVLKDVLG